MRNLLQFTLLLLFFAATASDVFAQRASAHQDGPRTFVVSPANPNPFHLTAQFAVSVERTQQVTVEVYNMLGQKVQDVFQGRLMSGERRVFVIEARSLPAGLYLYRVQAEDGVVSRQVTLLR